VVLDEDEFSTYMAEEPLDTYETNILTKLTGQGALEGSFRVVLRGQSLVRVRSTLATCCRYGSGKLPADHRKEAADIFFRRNGLTSDWVDAGKGIHCLYKYKNP